MNTWKHTTSWKSTSQRRPYEKFHGTETTPLKVQNDILWKIDNKHAVFLVLLDLSAAFGTIDHNIRLSLYFYHICFSFVNIVHDHDISVHTYADDTQLICHSM